MNKHWKGAVFFLVLGITAAAAIVTSSRLAAPGAQKHLAEQTREQTRKMMPQGRDNLSTSPFLLLAPNYLKMGDSQTATRVLEGDKPIQIIFTALSEKAYQDKIGVIASFDDSCTVMKVDIITEKETPGLGDQYKKNNYAWLKSLIGKGPTTNWNLKPKGDIDSWTGATVTPRAITRTLHRMQLLCVRERDLLFSTEPYVYLEIGKPDE
jgi:Na+-translocating ferredoxin:NAD+ oxidoreductase subunit G